MEERVPKQGKWPNLPPGNRPQEELARFSTVRLEESWPLFTDSVPGTSRRTFGHPIRSKSNRLTRSGISNFRESPPSSKVGDLFCTDESPQVPYECFPVRTSGLVFHLFPTVTIGTPFSVVCRQNKVHEVFGFFPVCLSLGCIPWEKPTKWVSGFHGQARRLYLATTRE